MGYKHFRDFPQRGDLCEVDMLVKVKAFYLPDTEGMQWITIDEDQELEPSILNWKKIPYTKSYDIYISDLNDPDKENKGYYDN